jgi:hypothetical protein
MKAIRLLFFFLPVLYVTVAAAQTDTSFISRANTVAAKQPPVEKVYLHLDKPSYNFSDTIWYKAYTRYWAASPAFGIKRGFVCGAHQP